MARRQSTILTVIRAGETTWDAEGRLHGRSDLPLSIDGRTAVTEDVRTLAGRRIPTVCHPADDAATETAAIVAAQVGARARTVAELADADLGVLEGMSDQAFADRFPKRFKQWQEDPLSLSAPDGEDLADARARLFAAVARLLRRSRGGELAIVLHAIGLGLLRCWLAERPPTDLWAMVRGRPRIERYVMAPPMAEWLADAAKAQYTHT